MPPMPRYALAFCVPLAATLMLTPLAARLAHRFDVLDHPVDHKTHRETTPYLGGLAVAIGLLLVAAFAGGASGELMTVLLGALVLAGVGLVDDVRGLSPLIRLAFEVVAVTNAMSFIDNMDGLAASVAVASTFGVAAIAASNGDYLVASFALAVAGACLGFLRYNAPPARIFLGDAGSMLLGFLIAALKIGRAHV